MVVEVMGGEDPVLMTSSLTRVAQLSHHRVTQAG